MDRADARLHATRDHYVPRRHLKQGDNTGIVICCATCNSIKGHMMPKEWGAFMLDHPGWWLLTKAQLRDIHRAAIGLPPKYRVYRARRRAIRAVIVPPHLVYGSHT